MRKLIQIFLLLVLSTLNAQSQVDSLLGVWNNTGQPDSLRLAAIESIIRSTINREPDSALVLIEMQLELAEQGGDQYYLCQAHLSRARIYAETGRLLDAIPEAETALTAAEQSGERSMVGLSHNVLGIILGMVEQHSEAIDHYLASMKVAEEQKDSAALFRGYRNVGIAFSAIKDYEKAEEYYLKSKSIAETTNDKKHLPFAYSALGNLYRTQGNVDKSLDNHRKVLEDSTLIVSTSMRSDTYLYIAQAYRKRERHDSALFNYKRSLTLKKSIKNKRAQATCYTGIGKTYLSLGQPKLAIQYCDSALVIARATNKLESERFACQCLYDTYKYMNNSDSALVYLEFAGYAKDSLIDIDREKEINRKELGYAFDKKAMADSLEFVRKESVMLERSEKQQIGLLAAGGGLLLVLALAFAIYSGKKKSDELLLNILPYETAQELKQKGQSDAKLIDEVTVLFSDFKGFTALSEQLSPKDLVEDLNVCFSEFDRIMEKYGIEKIKTIGDAYMAAGGVPTPTKDHARNVIHAALEMRDFVEAGKARKIEEGLPYFEIRIGVHTGPVVAGIVGIKKFQYDIWGDTVNTASRMESSGEAGKVNVSESTYSMVQDDFYFKYRGEVEAKGKGKLKMYFVEGDSADLT